MSALIKLPSILGRSVSGHPELDRLSDIKRAELMAAFRAYAIAIGDPRHPASDVSAIVGHLSWVGKGARIITHTFEKLNGNKVYEELHVKNPILQGKSVSYEDVTNVLIATYKTRVKGLATLKAMGISF